MAINPDLYWLVIFGVILFFIGILSGAMFIYFVAEKMPFGRNYSGLEEIFDATFSGENAKAKHAFFAMLIFALSGLLVLIFVVPILNGVV